MKRRTFMKSLGVFGASIFVPVLPDAFHWQQTESHIYVSEAFCDFLNREAIKHIIADIKPTDGWVGMVTPGKFPALFHEPSHLLRFRFAGRNGFAVGG